MSFAKCLMPPVAAALVFAAVAQQPVIHASDSKLAIKVTVDGERVNFPGTTPIMAGSRILVPLRGVFEKLGATVDWDRPSQTVTAVKGDTKVVLPIGKNHAILNGKPITLDQPAMVVDGRTVVPLRFLSQSLGAKVDWLAADRTVAVVTQS